MGEYEPRDSRNVTQKDGHAPGEPPRTGPREAQSRTDDPRDGAMPQDTAPAGEKSPGKPVEKSWRDSEKR